jgi:hypothetical protein
MERPVLERPVWGGGWKVLYILLLLLLLLAVLAVAIFGTVAVILLFVVGPIRWVVTIFRFVMVVVTVVRRDQAKK